MTHPPLSFELGKGNRNHLLFDEQYMQRNTFVICGLIAQVIKRRQELPQPVYAYGQRLETLHTLPSGRTGRITVFARTQDSEQGGHLVKIDVYRERKTTEEVQEERAWKKKQATKKRQPKLDQAEGKYCPQFLSPSERTFPFDKQLSNDNKAGFTFAEFETLYEGIGHPNKSLPSPESAAQALGEYLNSQGAKFEAMSFYHKRRYNVIDRAQELYESLA